MSHEADTPAGPRRIVLTLLGPDRPGIVSSVASSIAAHGGNWMESRMVRLGGQFAGLVQAQVPEHAFEPLCAAVEELQSGGLRITIEESSLESPPSSQRHLNLELVTPDRPGVLKEVSNILVEHGLNVEELLTEFSAAPWSGELLFKARLKVTAPSELSVEDLRSAIESTAAGMMLDLSVAVN